MSPSAPAATPTDLVKPFLWLGATGFLIGFVLCVALSAGRLVAPRQAERDAPLPVASEPPMPGGLAWKGERIT